jgi:hypothetical protein
MPLVHTATTTTTTTMNQDKENKRPPGYTTSPKRARPSTDVSTPLSDATPINRPNHSVYINPQDLIHHQDQGPRKKKTTSTLKGSQRRGIDLPTNVGSKQDAFQSALSVWGVGPPVYIPDTVKDAIFTLWEACNPGVGNKFFKQRSKWQRFVAFLFMILDNARCGRRIDCHIRRCKCVWNPLSTLATIQEISTRLCVKSSWYTTRQVQFMATLDRLSRTSTTSLDCMHCVHERTSCRI